MTALIPTQQKKRWVSLGMLFGGHTEYDGTPSPNSDLLHRPIATPEPAPLTAEQRAAAETMRAAGYEPQVRYSGYRTAPVPSTCITCGAYRRPTLQDVERGVRCKHRSTRRSASTP
ncbi:hypothetical protein ACIOJ9_29620 [Streptomyces sp. NPDC088175]|uniref:hypothetical protein n=1 Tax=unclassified Streptomyces TaxID=2593676 RepID=UPI00381F9DD5